MFERARLLRLGGDGKRADAIFKELEKKLNDAEIRKIKFLGGGQNETYKADLGNGIYAVFKPLNPERENQVHREVAAYRISKLFKLDLVPPTVLREVQYVDRSGKTLKSIGSFQLFVDTGATLEDKPSRAWEATKSGKRLKVFDWLINNHDRGSNHGNYLITADGEVAGVDHGVAFVANRRNAIHAQHNPDKVPVYSRSDIAGDHELYDHLTTPSENDIRDSLDGLRGKTKDELLERYHQLVEAVEKAM